MAIFKASGIRAEITQLRSEVQTLKDLFGTQMVPKQSFDALLKEYQRVSKIHLDLVERVQDCLPILDKIQALLVATADRQQQNLEGFAQAVLRIRPGYLGTCHWKGCQSTDIAWTPPDGKNLCQQHSELFIETDGPHPIE